MSERIILVTGATDGIGRHTALTLVRRGAHVIVHGRSRPKAEGVRDALRREVGTERVDAAWADLSSLDEVRELGRELGERYPKLDVLLNNAGVFVKERSISVDGHELTFAVNHLAPFLLTHLLLPNLRASDEPRIVNVSSMAHARGKIDWDDLQMEDDWEGYRAYATSKLMNVLFSFDLARRLTSPLVAVNALHPGVINTKLLREGFGMSGGSIDSGAATSVRVATDPALARTTGKYFSDERQVAAAAIASDRKTQERLYDVSVKLTGVTPLPLTGG